MLEINYASYNSQIRSKLANRAKSSCRHNFPQTKSRRSMAIRSSKTATFGQSLARRLLLCLCLAVAAPSGQLFCENDSAEAIADISFASDGGAFTFDLTAKKNDAFRPPAISVEEKAAEQLGNSVFLIDGLQLYLPDYQTSKKQQEMVKFGDLRDGRMLEQVAELLPPNPVIVDIGAGIGVRSCYWATKTDAIRVIAFEPIDRNCEAFRRNIKLNRLQGKVILNCLAVSDDNERLKVLSFNGNDATKIRLGTSGSNGPIDAKRLDSVDMDVGRIDLISVNVNGFEEQVLAGARQTLSKIRPTLILIGPLRRTGDATDEVDDLLTHAGYERVREFDGDNVLYCRIDH